jgi:hypothetical protein
LYNEFGNLLLANQVVEKVTQDRLAGVILLMRGGS